jgi:hypothetical protein
MDFSVLSGRFISPFIGQCVGLLLADNWLNFGPLLVIGVFVVGLMVVGLLLDNRLIIGQFIFYLLVVLLADNCSIFGSRLICRIIGRIDRSMIHQSICRWLADWLLDNLWSVYSW